MLKGSVILHVYSSTKMFESHFDFRYVYFQTFKHLVGGWESRKHLPSTRYAYRRGGGGLAFLGWDLQEGGSIRFSYICSQASVSDNGSENVSECLGTCLKSQVCDL